VQAQPGLSNRKRKGFWSSKDIILSQGCHLSATLAAMTPKFSYGNILNVENSRFLPTWSTVLLISIAKLKFNHFIIAASKIEILPQYGRKDFFK
jgi:hypothetical protein